MSSEGGYLSNLKVVHSESTQKALREHLKSTQRAIRDQESNQTSYRRSLKYFVLFDRASNGISKLPQIQLILSYESSFFRASLDIPSLNLHQIMEHLSLNYFDIDLLVGVNSLNNEKMFLRR